VVAAATRDFQVFAKPAGAFCNLDCSYCYYLRRMSLYPETPAPRMSEALLERYIVQHLEAAGGDSTSFSWHGGEPTTLGVDYFRKVVEFERKHASPGCTVQNGLQTNGVLLDEQWCRFLSANRFHVGISMDGPAELHDAYRVSRGGQPTHRQVLRGYELLRKHGVAVDVVCVVHNRNVLQPLSTYRFFREIGCKTLGFLPVVEPEPGADRGVSRHTPAAEDYGRFLCRIFDEWAARDTERMAVQTFEEASRPLSGMEHSLCVFRETCGQIPVLEHNGDVYPCDHFVDAGRLLGNIASGTLSQFLDGQALREFGTAKRSALTRYCRQCEVLDMCNGGCPKYRFIRSPEGEPGLDYLCAGMKLFFLHCREPLRRMLARQEAPPAAPHPAASAGRNDACPCGSGRKFKKCCGK
jgi:uncharacterized protein